ncbi:glutathione s transferase d10 isoform a-related [Holotrichia oblita]|uniref:Glutathione s transferase d10 isoform a-related n=1 Tax=Holotrichia oblita TaxID=644536 RepID=A0ACB9T014_HOLOL|nr:glutathione s transferase d10 isoform a-related [Holotrichia oblita]
MSPEYVKHRVHKIQFSAESTAHNTNTQRQGIYFMGKVRHTYPVGNAGIAAILVTTASLLESRVLDVKLCFSLFLRGAINSRAILQYLTDRYGKDDTLNPKIPKRSGMVNQILYFDACTLNPRILQYFRPIVFQHQPPDPESAEKVEEALGYLNAFLDNHPWVAGPYMTVADFAVVATVATAKADDSGIDLSDSEYEQYDEEPLPFGVAEVDDDDRNENEDEQLDKVLDKENEKE